MDLEFQMILIPLVLDVKHKIVRIAMVMKPMDIVMFVSKATEESLLVTVPQIQIFHFIVKVVIVIV